MAKINKNPRSNAKRKAMKTRKGGVQTGEAEAKPESEAVQDNQTSENEDK